MAAKTSTLAEAQENEKPAYPDNSTEGIILDADYAEDRPVALLAERQREFQKSLRGYYVDAEMPALAEARVALVKSLLASGAIPFIPEGRSGPAPRPIPVRGEPVSETISAERG
jgi:hypothetical protein